MSEAAAASAGTGQGMASSARVNDNFSPVFTSETLAFSAFASPDFASMVTVETRDGAERPLRISVAITRWPAQLGWTPSGISRGPDSVGERTPAFRPLSITSIIGASWSTKTKPFSLAAACSSSEYFRSIRLYPDPAGWPPWNRSSGDEVMKAMRVPSAANLSASSLALSTYGCTPASPARASFIPKSIVTAVGCSGLMSRSNPASSPLRVRRPMVSPPQPVLRNVIFQSGNLESTKLSTSAEYWRCSVMESPRIIARSPSRKKKAPAAGCSAPTEMSGARPQAMATSKSEMYFFIGSEAASLGPEQKTAITNNSIFARRWPISGLMPGGESGIRPDDLPTPIPT